MNIFEDLETATAERSAVVKAPFSWPGAKSRSLDMILPRLPYGSGYVEVFGGSGVVLLNRRKSQFECFNDRHSGVTDFYRCVQDHSKLEQLVEKIRYSVMSKELFNEYRDTWITTEDPIERAYRWYYSVMLSFGRLGRNYGRALSGSTLMVNLLSKLEGFHLIHERMKTVQIENASWEEMLHIYDKPGNVFYLDPPYLNSYSNTYAHELTVSDHANMLQRIQNMRSTVVVSHFKHELYDSYSWDKVYSWPVYVSIKSNVSEGNRKQHLENLSSVTDRGVQEECLYIKKAL